MKVLIMAILAIIALTACAIVPDDEGGIGIGIGVPYHHGWR